MKVNLNLLPWKINDFVEIPSWYYKNTDIIKLEMVHVLGKIDYNLSDEISIDFAINGKMILNDAITNEEIEYPFSIKIEEILEENAKYLEKSKNMLDIIELLWENIVLEVPISYTKASGAKLKGEGWELNNEAIEEKIDPRMEKLIEFFKGGE